MGLLDKHVDPTERAVAQCGTELEILVRSIAKFRH